MPIPSIDNRVESGNTGPVMGNSSLRECLARNVKGSQGFKMARPRLCQIQVDG